MKTEHYFLTFFILTVAQILVCNYLNLSHYITLSFLPLLVLCIPIRYGTIPSMLVAFAAGLSVDIFSEGVIGLNALSLVPVAALRIPIISAVFGTGLLARKEDLSIGKHGFFKFSTAILIAQAIFLVLYIWTDGAGMRTFSFNLLKFLCSLGAGFVVSIFILVSVSNNNRESKWK